uniref:Uncharacterized protein n=1 Tax=Anopheles culicifacies TaxID=139723 RepID=A0A182M7B5_9DIPT
MDAFAIVARGPIMATLIKVRSTPDKPGAHFYIDTVQSTYGHFDRYGINARGCLLPMHNSTVDVSSNVPHDALLFCFQLSVDYQNITAEIMLLCKQATTQAPPSADARGFCWAIDRKSEYLSVRKETNS